MLDAKAVSNILIADTKCSIKNFGGSVRIPGCVLAKVSWDFISYIVDITYPD